MAELQTPNEIAASFLQDYVNFFLRDELYDISGAPITNNYFPLGPVENPKNISPQDKTGYDILANTGYSVYGSKTLLNPPNIDLFTQIPLALKMIDPPNVCTICMNPSWDTAVVPKEQLTPNCQYAAAGAECLSGSYPPSQPGSIVGLPTCNVCTNAQKKSNIAPPPINVAIQLNSKAPPSPPSFLNIPNININALGYWFCYSDNCENTFSCFLTNQPNILFANIPQTAKESIWRLYQIYYDPGLDTTGPANTVSKLNQENMSTFLRKNMKWLNKCCANSQSISSVSVNLYNKICNKPTVSGENTTGPLKSDIYGLPISECDSLAREHCVGGSPERIEFCKCKSITDPNCQLCLFKNKDEDACSCFEWNKFDETGKKIPWRGPLSSLEYDTTIGSNYDAYLYKFMQYNNPTDISRKCILNNCKDKNSYKTADMLRNKCPELCTSMLYNQKSANNTDPDNYSNVDIKDTVITVRCGGAEHNYYTGNPSLAPGYKPPTKGGLALWQYLVIGIPIFIILLSIIVFAIIKHRKKYS